MTLPALTFAPLDHEGYKVRELLFRAQHCAHPVQREGRTAYIANISTGQSGGSVEMLIYLTGDPKAYGPHEITLQPQPE